MSQEFCDRSPCLLLQKFVRQLAVPAKTPAVLQAVVLPHGTGNVLTPVTFNYCPFCGTRLEGNDQVCSWIECHRAGR